MTTPRKSEIDAKAVELFFKDQYRKGFEARANPERQELSENGVLIQARDALMRNEERSQVLSYLEQIANENGYELVKSKKASEYCQDLETYPVEVILREGCFATGGRGSGKSNLLKLLIVEAIRAKVRVKVFDPSLAWKDFPLSKIKVKRNVRVDSQWNRIYDVSRLSVLEARNFVRDVMKNDLTEAIVSTDQGFKNRCLVVIEEAQNIIPSHSLREKKFLDISRFITQGRNFGLSFIASTQRLSSVDINLIEISGVRYWFKLEGHRNLTKARYWLDKYTTWRLRNLEVGQCYIQIGSKIRLLRLPLFEEARVIV